MLSSKYNRSLSPHLLLYKTHATSVVSIFHRITGSVFSILLFFISLFLVLSYSFFSCNFFYSIFAVFYILVNLFFSLLLFFPILHILNGFRHIFWDLCVGLSTYNIVITGFFVSFTSFLFVCFFVLI